MSLSNALRKTFSGGLVTLVFGVVAGWIFFAATEVAAAPQIMPSGGASPPTLLVRLRVAPIYSPLQRQANGALEVAQIAAVTAVTQSVRLSVAEALGVKAEKLSARDFRPSLLYPFVAVISSPAVAAALSAHPDVEWFVDEPYASNEFLNQTTSQIGTSVAQSVGAFGAGQAVAIVDSGVDRSHSFLGGATRLVAEGCFASSFLPSIPSACTENAVNGSEATGSGGALPPARLWSRYSRRRNCSGFRSCVGRCSIGHCDRYSGIDHYVPRQSHVPLYGRSSGTAIR